MEVEIIRSTRRRKTVCATLREGKLIVRIPHRTSKKEEKRLIEEFSRKLLARVEAKKVDSDELLVERARALSDKYFKGQLQFRSIRFVTNQTSCFGTCQTLSGDIRISHRLKTVPRWVLDYVIIHELVHLIYPDHSKAFWELVNRFPRTERARGFLIAMSLEKDDPGYSLENK